VAAITKLCGGVPRRINAIADHALFAAHVAGRVSATAADVASAAAELALVDEADVGAAAPRAAEEPAPARPAAYMHALKRRSGPAVPLAAASHEESEPEIELGDVIAEPTGRRAAASAAAASDLSPIELPGACDIGREPLPADDSAELEDLFADIVDE